MTGITRVQGPYRATTTTNQCTVTLGSNPTSGNVLIATVDSMLNNYAHVVSVTQTNVTWALAKSATYNNYLTVEIWYGVASGTNIPKAIVFNFSAALTTYNGGADVCEYSGIATTTPVDQTASDTGANSTLGITGTTSTTVYDNELWIGAVDWYNGSNFSVGSATSGFTLQDTTVWSSGAGYRSIGFLEKIATSKGAANSSDTANLQGWHCGCIATFKPLVINYTRAVSDILGGIENQYFAVTGITKTVSGTVLGGCTVNIHRTDTGALLGTTTSNADTGVYLVNIQYSGPIYIVCFKSGSPDVEGVSDNTLIGGKNL